MSPDVDAGGVEVDPFQNGVIGLGGLLRFLEGFLAIACGTFQVEAQRLGPRGS